MVQADEAFAPGDEGCLEPDSGRSTLRGPQPPALRSDMPNVVRFASFTSSGRKGARKWSPRSGNKQASRG